VGHTDSVSALANTINGHYLISGGHDGALRCWDIRKQQCLYDIPAHRKKYDEGINFIAPHPNESVFAS
jgi:striatin 1/3/4